MDVRLNPELQMLRETVREVVDERIAPAAHHYDTTGECPWTNLRLLGELGLFGLGLPEEYGGVPGGILANVIVTEELARGCRSTAAIRRVSWGGTWLLAALGTEAQRQRYLPDLVAGRTLTCGAWTEPEAGSDRLNISTTAVRDGDGWVLNGFKHYISNWQIADVYRVWARTGELGAADSLSLFIVEKGTPGFAFGARHEKMGSNAFPTGELVFTDCRVPAEQLLGQVGKGAEYGWRLMSRLGPVLGAEALGVAQAALEASLAYARTRVQFGRPIGEFQAVQLLLADMAIDVAAARSLVYKAAAMADSGELTEDINTAAKVFAGEMVNRVAASATRVFAGAGYMRGCPVERLYRDARIFTTAEGTSEVMRVRLAEMLLAADAHRVHADGLQQFAASAR